jgi:hypothetical protein
MAPGSSTLLRKGSMASRLGSSTGASAMSVGHAKSRRCRGGEGDGRRTSVRQSSIYIYIKREENLESKEGERWKTVTIFMGAVSSSNRRSRGRVRVVGPAGGYGTLRVRVVWAGPGGSGTQVAVKGMEIRA